MIEEAGDSPIAILNHNKATAYLVPAKMYEKLMNLLEDYELGQLVEERRKNLDQAIDVDIDDL